MGVDTKMAWQLHIQHEIFERDCCPFTTATANIVGVVKSAVGIHVHEFVNVH
jgi:hypothetical protein